MPIKSKVNTTSIFFFLVLSSFFTATSIYGQVVWENYQNEVYNYLGRMAQKGLITFDDVSRPVNRSYIAKGLGILQDESTKLSLVEKKELDFYLREYGSASGLSATDSATVGLFKKDAAGRWRALSIKNKDFVINADPILQGGRIYANGKHYTHQSVGMQVWGQIGKHIGFQFYGNDVTESRDGNGQDSFAYRGPEPGFVLLTDTGSHKSMNYSVIRASIGYSWKNGSISIGQDNLLWGYGENGRIVLSDKAPAYPYLRLDYRPFPWFKFQYIHAWLNSDIIDSSRTYSFGNTVYGGRSVQYVPKFMASHSITITPTKGLDISAGESIIYSDQLNIGYFIPVMFFKLYDNLTSNNNVLAGSNGQFFFQASSRNMLKKTHLYSTLFIDEIRIAQIFNPKKSRNQLGFTFGASVTDVFIPYLTLNAEYTRVNPFVYNNLNPAQTYTNHSFYMGDWMGNNFDRIILSARYTPVAKLKCLLRYQYIRKGGPGTIDQQYFAEPQPPFLFDYRFNQTELYLNLSYQWIPNLYFNFSVSALQQNNKITAQKTNNNTVNVGISYGL